MDIKTSLLLCLVLVFASCSSDPGTLFVQEEPQYYVSGVFGSDSIRFTVGDNATQGGGSGGSSGNAGGPTCHTREFIYATTGRYDVYLRVVLDVGSEDISWSSNYNPYIFTLSETAYTRLREGAEVDEDDCFYYTPTGVSLSVRDKSSGNFYSTLYQDQSSEMYFFGEYFGGVLNADFNCTLADADLTEEINFKGALSLWID